MSKCSKCRGKGRFLYSNTSTWYGGWGGSAMTEDICDECWGSGDTENPGPNRRSLLAKASEDDEILELLRHSKILRNLLEEANHLLHTETGKPFIDYWWRDPDPDEVTAMKIASIDHERFEE